MGQPPGHSAQLVRAEMTISETRKLEKLRELEEQQKQLEQVKVALQSAMSVSESAAG